MSPSVRSSARFKSDIYQAFKAEVLDKTLNAIHGTGGERKTERGERSAKSPRTPRTPTKTSSKNPRRAQAGPRRIFPTKSKQFEDRMHWIKNRIGKHLRDEASSSNGTVVDSKTVVNNKSKQKVSSAKLRAARAFVAGLHFPQSLSFVEPRQRVKGIVMGQEEVELENGTRLECVRLFFPTLNNGHGQCFWYTRSKLIELKLDHQLITHRVEKKATNAFLSHLVVLTEFIERHTGESFDDSRLLSQDDSPLLYSDDDELSAATPEYRESDSAEAHIMMETPEPLDIGHSRSQGQVLPNTHETHSISSDDALADDQSWPLIHTDPASKDIVTIEELIAKDHLVVKSIRVPSEDLVEFDCLITDKNSVKRREWLNYERAIQYDHTVSKKLDFLITQYAANLRDPLLSFDTVSHLYNNFPDRIETAIEYPLGQVNGIDPYAIPPS